MRVSILALCATLLAAGPLGAAEPLGPMARTREVLEKSHDIVTGTGDHRHKVNALRELLQGYLDTDAMGRAAMGEHLAGKSPSEVAEFLRIFQDLFVRTYVQRLLLFDAPDFGFRKETITGATATVATEIVTPRDRFGVDYRMKKAGDGWHATDILVEDVSLGDNFRSQFDAALTKESFPSLMGRLRTKLSAPEKSDL